AMPTCGACSSRPGTAARKRRFRRRRPPAKIAACAGISRQFPEFPMKILARAVLVLALFLPGLASAQATPESRAEAVKLLEALNMRSMMDQMINLTLDSQLEAKPELKPYRGVMMKFFEKYMSYDSLEPQMVEIYAGAFTAKELAEIRAWYASPTGK